MEQFATLLLAALAVLLTISGASFWRNAGVLWPFGFACLLLSGFVSSVAPTAPAAQALAAVLSTLFPAMLLLDALVRVGKSLVGAAALGMAAAVTRALLVVHAGEPISKGFSAVADPAFLVAAAAVFFVHRGKLGDSLAERLLAPALLWLAVTEAVAGISQAREGGGPPFVAWALVGGSFVGLQLVSTSARIRQRAEDLRSVGERATAEARRSEGRLQDLMESGHTLAAEIDLAGQCRWASPGFEHVLGHERARIVGRNLLELVHTEDRNAALAAFRQATDDAPATARVRALHRDGSWTWLDLDLRAQHEASGATRMAVVARNVSELIEARDREQASERRYRVLSEHTGDVLSELGPDTTMLWISPNVVTVLGYAPEELVGRPLADITALMETSDASTFEGAVTAEELGERERPGQQTRVRTKEGHERFMETHATPYRTVGGDLRVLLLSRDVTRRVLDSRRRERDRSLERLRVFGSGVAHHVNNLLTVIGGNAALLRDDPHDAQRVARHASEIETAAGQAARLTREVMRFSGSPRPQANRVDLAELIEGLSLRHALPREVELVATPGDGPALVHGEHDELRDLVDHLLRNAVEACSAAGGTVHVGFERVRVEAPAPGRIHAPDFAPGPHVALEVRDTGPGMSAETRARAFEPFFGTRAMGRGLGLAVVLGTALAHRGAVGLESEPGKGTRIVVLLPEAEPDDA